MTEHKLSATMCGEEACLELHEAALHILENTGVEVKHEEGLALLGDAGAKVDGTRVRMSAALVRDALESAPKQVSLRSRIDREPLVLEAGRTYFGSGSDCLYIAGPGTRDRRPGGLGDVEEMAALQEKCPEIDFVLSMAHPHELAPDVAPVAQFAAMLRGTSKPLIMVPENADHLETFQEMAAAAGAADSWALYAMPTSPLSHSTDAVDRLIGCARLDVPMCYAAAPLPGATGPASVTACIVLAAAEILSGLVITQLAKKGAPYVYGIAQGTFNLRTSHPLYAAPEGHIAQQVGADMARFYGLPSFGYGGVSDSQLLDEQWALEAGMSILAGATSRATLVHDLGYVASGTASSYEAVVLMNDLARYVRRFTDGIRIDEAALALNEIEAIGPGGEHLATKYTRAHYRDYFGSDLLSQQSYDSWSAAGSTTLLERVAEKTKELREAPREYALPDGAEAVLVASVEAALVGSAL